MVELEPWNEGPRDDDAGAQHNQKPSSHRNGSIDEVMRNLDMDADAFKQQAARNFSREDRTNFSRQQAQVAKALNSRTVLGCLALWFFGPFIAMIMLMGVILIVTSIYDMTQPPKAQDRQRVQVEVIDAGPILDQTGGPYHYRLKLRFPADIGNGFAPEMAADTNLYMRYKDVSPEQPGTMWVRVDPDNPRDWKVDNGKQPAKGEPVVFLIIGCIMLFGSLSGCGVGYYLWRRSGKTRVGSRKKSASPGPGIEYDSQPDEDEDLRESRNRLNEYK
jgi:hypothetical protein